MADRVSTTIEEGVATIRMDDGKANALGPAMQAAVGEALDEAEAAGAAVVLTGRSGCLSAGFDLAVMREGGAAGAAMVRGGGELSIRLGRFPAPVVVASTGHAVAMGALLLLSADLRLGSAGNFKICFNEVAIGTATPLFLLEQARERLSKRYFYRATVQSELYDPAAAVNAGFLDRLVEADQLEDIARSEAQRLAALPRQPFIETRARAREATLGAIEKTMQADVEGLFGVS